MTAILFLQLAGWFQSLIIVVVLLSIALYVVLGLSQKKFEKLPPPPERKKPVLTKEMLAGIQNYEIGSYIELTKDEKEKVDELPQAHVDQNTYRKYLC